MDFRKLAGLIAFCLGAMLAASAAAQVRTLPAGPIWNNSDAQGKCSSVCSRAGMDWRGVWRTPQMSMQSECDCVGRAGERGPGPDHGRPGWEHHRPGWDHHGPSWSHRGPTAGGSGSSCRAPSVRQCRGCSVSCRADQTAHCTEGSVGIFTGPNDTICSREARCECR